MPFKRRGNSEFQRYPKQENPYILYFKAVGKKTENQGSDCASTMTSSPCIFCLDEQRAPRGIACGHSFCADCFERYLKLGQDTRCPLCRRDFRPDIQSAPSTTSPAYALSAEADSDSGDMELQTDTLVLTLSEQECRFFEQLYREIRQTNSHRTEF